MDLQPDLHGVHELRRWRRPWPGWWCWWLISLFVIMFWRTRYENYEVSLFFWHIFGRTQSWMSRIHTRRLKLQMTNPNPTFIIIDVTSLPSWRGGPGSWNKRTGRLICRRQKSNHLNSNDNDINSLTAKSVPAGTKNSRPVGFYSRNSTESTLHHKHTIHKHHHHGGAVRPSFGVGSMDPPDRTRVTSSEGVGRGGGGSG
jgi:hypothetical protein